MLGNMLRLGAVCGKPYVVGRLYTCSETCHESLMDELVKESGEFKKVVDAEARTYEVST